ncbi:MAG TPA: four helix bundle protein [Ohtaekwangia sp.]|nr:four helix bundle protein [Ohtaekwangia sp.]
MKDFKKLLIWKKGMELVEETDKAVAFLPTEEKYGLRSQATRAAVSVVLNIAEGSAKTSKKEYKNYLGTSLGSAFELETILLVIERLRLIKKEAVEVLIEELREQRMISSLINKVRADVQ